MVLIAIFVFLFILLVLYFVYGLYTIITYFIALIIYWIELSKQSKGNLYNKSEGNPKVTSKDKKE
jgi:hypothetical protein